MPTGSIAMWPTATAPTNWLFLDGATYNQSTYPALAAVFGVTSGTFTLPDMRDRFAAGASTVAALSNNAGTFAPNTSNSTLHYHATNIAHDHADTFAVSTHGDHTHTTDPAAVTSGAASGTAFPMGTSTTNPYGAHTHSVNVAATASGAESTNLTHTVTGGVTALGTTSVQSTDGNSLQLPKSTLLNFIIKT
jgi:microcystin-dependent protein